MIIQDNYTPRTFASMCMMSFSASEEGDHRGECKFDFGCALDQLEKDICQLFLNDEKKKKDSSE